MKLSSRVTLILFLALFGNAALAQSAGLQIEHTVSLTDIAKQQFHVRSDYKNLDQPTLSLSLPTWAPGWYTVENYYKNVLRFRITDQNGKVMPLRMTRKQTWLLDTRGVKELRVDFDYHAAVLGLNQAKIASDYAFFTGIQLFLEPVGHRSTPATVRFNIPSGWKLASALKETADPMLFTAADYDTLVDAPTLMGKFDLTRFEVDGKPHYLAAVPAGAFSADKSKRFTEMLAATIKSQGAVFGGLPYDKYIAYYFFQPAESNASGALEHLNSYVAFAPGGSATTPEDIIGTGSHEFFHLWNVKRIRPAEMWPYDYSRENESPLLWVSEGFTNYYGALATYRAGVTSREQFLSRVAGAAAGMEGTDARSYVSPANASVSTWVGYDTPQAFTISYYTAGQNLAALLDLSILHDTGGRFRLDDVMRSLYDRHYKLGRGFTTEDMISIIEGFTGKSYRDFFDRYVFGTEVPEYDRVFGYAGYKIEKVRQEAPDFGFNVRPRNGGLMVNGVEPNSPAAAAGLRPEDVIMKINNVAVFSAPISTLAGKTVPLHVLRDGKETQLSMKVGSRAFTDYALSAVPNATAEQAKIRELWLKK